MTGPGPLRSFASALERIPIRRNRLIEKDSLQLDKFGACPHRKAGFGFSGHALARHGTGLCAYGIAIVLLAAPAFAQAPPSGTLLPGANSKDPIQIEATKLDYFDRDHKLVYTGKVVAIQGASKLEASSLVIFLLPKGAGETPGIPSSSSEVRRMEAEGPVTLTSKDQVGTGDSGVFEKSENKVYLIGNVTLSQGPNVTVGDKLVYDLSTNRAVVTGKVKSMFVPKDGKTAAPRR